MVRPHKQHEGERMKTLDQIPPVKKAEFSFTARQFLRWSKYWMACKDKQKQERLFKQARILGELLERENTNAN